jgi:hypothetical protein
VTDPYTFQSTQAPKGACDKKKLPISPPPWVLFQSTQRPKALRLTFAPIEGYTPTVFQSTQRLVGRCDADTRNFNVLANGVSIHVAFPSRCDMS